MFQGLCAFFRIDGPISYMQGMNGYILCNQMKQTKKSYMSSHIILWLIVNLKNETINVQAFIWLYPSVFKKVTSSRNISEYVWRILLFSTMNKIHYYESCILSELNVLTIYGTFEWIKGHERCKINNYILLQNSSFLDG